MKSMGIIPARWGSTRFPGKPLAMIQGKSMIRRVYEQAQKSKWLDDVVVATDDKRIASDVEAFGGQVMMTSSNHNSGTDRCAEVIQKFEKNGEIYDLAVNIQGDEPMIDPEQIDLLIKSFDAPNIQIATLARKIESEDELTSPNVVKVVFSEQNQALYFSRHPIPYQKTVPLSQWLTGFGYFKHIGLYAYRTHILKKIAQLQPGKIEQAESLEQLRWLENGYSIHIKITDRESFAIDTPDDLLKFTNIC
ncbi:MAG: 3-deoxy-manno-octulosonate cytidylyltransferase [Bacteroidales bacterium]|nr:3-deoxy-manno-octulosonate cytidylyltransferase [Bacteroidales bacterium]